MIQIVKIKDNRICKRCNKIINKGNNAYTVSKYKQGRFWLCIDCIKEMQVNNTCSNYKDIKGAEKKLSNITFDDDGVYLAYDEALKEYKSNCIECGKCAYGKELL